MKSFKQFIKEETMPYAVTASGSINIQDPSVLDGLNVLLAGVTNEKFVTPYIAFERVQKALANFLIFPNKPTFLEGDSGVYTNPISQFGDKFGQDNSGNFIDSVPTDLHLFFEYRLSDCGMFMVFCEVVTEDELAEITDDLEAELSGEGEEDLNEQKFTNRASDSKNDMPMSNKATIPGASTPVPSGSFSPRVPTRGTKDLDQMNRDAEGNTVVEARRAKGGPGTIARAKKVKEDEVEEGIGKNIKRDHYYRMAQQLRDKLKTNDDVKEGTESLADIDKKIDWHQKAMANVQYRGPQNTFHKKKLQELLKKRKEMNRDAEGNTVVEEEEPMTVSGVAKKMKEKKKEQIEILKKKAFMNALKKGKKKMVKEEQINELSDKLKARYRKKAETDKIVAGRSADFSEYEARRSDTSPAQKKKFADEGKWLRSIEARRAKGIERSKK